MRLGATGSDNFIPHLFRKGNIHKFITVDVAQLAFAQTIFRATKAMRRRGHARPARDGFMNFLSRAMDYHKVSKKESIAHGIRTAHGLRPAAISFLGGGAGNESYKKLPNGLKDDQRILFSNPLVAFPSVGNIKLLQFFLPFRLDSLTSFTPPIRECLLSADEFGRGH